MADPIVVPTPAPGASTTEFQLTKYITIIGGILTAALALCSQLQEFLPTGNKLAGYVTLAASIITGALVVLKALGYTGGRSDQKVAAIEAQGAIVAAQIKAQAGQNAGAAAEAFK